MHTGCFSVSIVHGTLAWTTGSLRYAQMLMHAEGGGGTGTDTIRESALKVDSGRKIPCLTGESYQCQQCASPLLSQLNYIPTPGQISLCLGCRLNEAKGNKEDICLADSVNSVNQHFSPVMLNP